MAIVKILRTPRSVAAIDVFPGFGTVIRADDKVVDPEGVVIEKAMADAIRLEPNFKKIPATLTSRIVDLYIRMLGDRKSTGSMVDSTNEVSVVLLRDVETMSQWRVLVPTQEVGGASVEADYTKEIRDIVTGEVVEWVPDGWAHAGSSHSHNTMAAFFSATDDRSELPVPGIHFVLGSFVKNAEGAYNFTVATSIVYHGKRYEKVFDEETGKPRDLHWKDLMEFGGREAAHDDVFNLVTLAKSTVYSAPAGVLYLGRGDGDFDGYSDYYRRRGLMSTDSKKRITEEDIPDLLGMSTELLRAWMWKLDDALTESSSPNLFMRIEMYRLKNYVPVFMYPTTESEYIELEDVEYKQVLDGPVARLWVPRQVTPTIDDFRIGLVTVVPGPNGAIRFFGSVGRTGSDANIQMFPIWKHAYESRLKNQRGLFGGLVGDNKRGRKRIGALLGRKLTTDTKGSEKDNKDELDLPLKSATEFEKTNVSDFTTRGVKATDFTSHEIERLVEAWASNSKQRSDLRIALNLVRARVDGKKEGNK